LNRRMATRRWASGLSGCRNQAGLVRIHGSTP
jgi:hypothetical protein